MSTTRNGLPTRLGHAGWSDHRFRGHSLFDELLGRTSFWGLWSLALDGPGLTPVDERVLDALAVCSSAADPRIPPMKIIRLLGAYGGVMAAVAGGFAYQEDALIGTWTAGAAARDLLDLHETVQAACHASVASRVDALPLVLEAWQRQGRRLAGFGIPARPVDERVVGLRRRIEPLGRSSSPFWCLAEETERTLAGPRPLPLNIAGAAAAACLDIGFRPRQIAVLSIAFAQHAFVGNALEGADAAPALLRRLPCASVAYVGPPPRRSPRAGGESGA